MTFPFNVLQGRACYHPNQNLNRRRRDRMAAGLCRVEEVVEDNLCRVGEAEARLCQAE